MTGRILRGVVALAAGAIAFWLWWRAFDGPLVLRVVLRADVGLVLFAIVLVVAAQAFRLLRWHLLLRQLAVVPLAKTFRLLYASELLNNVLPVKVGDLGRAVALAGGGHGLSLGAATATMVVDRLYGIGARVLALSLLVVVPSRLPASLRLSAGLFAVGLVCAVAALAAWRRHGDRIANLFAPALRVLPTRARLAVGRTLRSFADATVAVGIRGALASQLAAVSIASLVAQAAGVAALFWAVGHRMPLATALVGAALLDLLAVVPAPPAGVGTTEWYGTLVFATGLSQPLEATAAVTLLYHAVWLLFVFVAGGLSISAVGEMLPRRWRREAAR